MTQTSVSKNLGGLYEPFLASACGEQWRQLGVRRRAGVNVPLFSLYSKKSTGIGELPDFKLLIDWCVKTGLSIIQLLPMNDVGFDFRPYDAQSTFAFEPMFLRPEDFRGVDAEAFRNEISELRTKFPSGRERVDYGIKAAKLQLFSKMFDACGGQFPEDFKVFQREQSFWLRPYTIFKVLKEKFPHTGWEGWDASFRTKDENTLRKLEEESSGRLLFHAWLQWQLAEQFQEVKLYAQAKEVALMGDLPFLVSRDSADVWWHQNYFKLDRVSGAPPDAYIAEGQRWGMPPYQWENISARGYDYVREKVKYAARFFDMFRIDHVVGLFRLWTIAEKEPFESAGLAGQFDPADESLWEEHGRKILSEMMGPTRMLPCAEDLGVVPPCATKVLGEFAIPGMDVQRWNRFWESGGAFKKPEDYRPCSCAVISTHDMPVFTAWWKHEVGTVDEWIFRKACEDAGIDFAALRERLFGEALYGRLRWSPAIRNTDDLVRAIGREAGQIQGILSLSRDSFFEKRKFLDYLGFPEDTEDPPLQEIVKRALEKASESYSVFSVQLIHDYLSLGGYFFEDSWNARVNFPGSVGPQNWSVVLPVSLEKLNRLEINQELKNIHQRTSRSE